MPIQLKIEVKNLQALHVRWTHLKFIELVFNVRKLFLMPCIMFLAWDQITLYSSSNITQWKIFHNGHITTNNEIAKHFLLDLSATVVIGALAGTCTTIDWGSIRLSTASQSKRNGCLHENLIFQENTKAFVWSSKWVFLRISVHDPLNPEPLFHWSVFLN